MTSPLRLAYFSPLPPQHTGVADYSAGLLPYLHRHADITLFVDDPAGIPDPLAHQFPIQPITSYPEQRLQYDAALYHVGNNRHHETIYDLALRYPGVVVLHDYYLHPYLADRAAREENFTAYARELAYARGAAGVRLGWQVRSGQIPRPDTAFPLNDRLLDLSLGVIVHNQTVAKDCRTRRPGVKVAVIPHFVRRHTAVSRRPELDWPEEAVIVGHCGYMTANRQMPLFMRALARLHEQMPQCRLLIVGEIVNQEVDVAGLIAEHGLADRVHVTGYVPDQQTFLDWMATADFLVNLRFPTMGETSGTTLLALAIARPVILFDHGWYGELPPDVCRQSPVMDEEALLLAMMTLAAEPDLRRQIGVQAQAYAREVGDPERISGDYIAFIRRVLLRPN